MPDPLLSSLCTICHVHPHKYRCPRCFALTCSLPCIKRHKQWAQCNGVRDPTKYMKIADLATPKGIDHDYNYLTSIERELDYAEKNALSRGFVLEEETRRGKRPVKGETKLNAAFERCRVIVTKAPKGMTRSKQNATLCSRKNRALQWTVEWVHPDGKRTMDKLWETQCISSAYDDHLRSLDPSRPRKRPKADRKQKHHAASAISISPSVPPHEAPNGERVNGSPTIAATGKRKREEGEANVNHDAEKENRIIAVTTGLSDEGAVHQPAELDAAAPAIEPAPTLDLTFYLHHPSLPSRHPVLIPLPSDANLATSLTNRIVLEFPTIYVLHRQADGRLPEEYVYEEDFFASTKKELVEEIAGEGEVSVGGGLEGVVEEGKAGGLEDGEVDEGRLMEVLGKDLNGVAGSL